jgi:hypothetical protein
MYKITKYLKKKLFNTKYQNFQNCGKKNWSNQSMELFIKKLWYNIVTELIIIHHSTISQGTAGKITGENKVLIFLLWLYVCEEVTSELANYFFVQISKDLTIMEHNSIIFGVCFTKVNALNCISHN